MEIALFIYPLIQGKGSVVQGKDQATEKEQEERFFHGIPFRQELATPT